ncbi:MAG: hypothetical protein GC164_14005 [Phycisphaera sp.]|nr:hypothetical protein [Phycisphaera sp.]
MANDPVYTTRLGTYKSSSIGLPTVATNYELSGAGDYDLVGDPDLYWRDTNTLAISAWNMSGATRTQTGDLNISGGGTSGYLLERIDDLDGDGTPDLVWYDTATSRPKWSKLSGSTIVSTSFIGNGAVTGFDIAG